MLITWQRLQREEERTTIIFRRKDLSCVVGASWRRRRGGRGVREAKRELLPDLNGVGNGFELSFLS